MEHAEPERPSDDELARAAALIRGGGLVAFPTETVYGLGANALDETAVRKIFQVKERPWASPLIVHVADVQMARTVCREWPPLAQKLSQHFWPGPLTLVVQKAPIVPDVVTASLPSVGVRVPRHPVALELIRRAGVPIAAPSANRFTEVSPTTAAHVKASLGERVDMILDGGSTDIGIESTVLAIHRHPPALLRPGMITKAQIEQVGGIRLEQEIDKPHIAESPGQHPKHYSPRTRFILLDEHTALPVGRGRTIKMPREAGEFAHRLYAELHQADAEGWDWIAIEAPVRSDEWAGILDRLQRAAGKAAD